MLFQQAISTQPFKFWLWKDKENKRLLWFAAVVMVISFSWLKIVYPYPNFMPPDSYSYLEAASANLFINLWPIGYSKFLRLVSIFSRSDMVLVIFQYLLLQASVLHFLFTIRYILVPGRWLFRVLFIISISNPLLPHIANFVSGDCLFATLSLVWFTQLLWIIYQPSRKLLLFHAIILLLAFTVRFNALYYPFISIIIVLFIRRQRRIKWIGVGFIVFILSCFILLTVFEYKTKTGTSQYSGFGGWLMAANALYGYAHVKPDDPAAVPAKFRRLHQMVNRHMDSIRLLPIPIRPDRKLGVYYFWDFKSPLRLYMDEWWPNNNKNTYFKRWASMAPLYAEYGRYLIVKHPEAYIKYYAWPNLIRYYAPPVNFMGSYNMGNKTVDSLAVNWFDWKTNRLPTRIGDTEIKIVNVFPTLLSIINPLFLLSSMLFIFFTGFRQCSGISKRIIGCMLVVWFANAFFSVFSAPIELRYQLFPIIITLPFGVLFISWIMRAGDDASNIYAKQTISLSEPAI